MENKLDNRPWYASYEKGVSHEMPAIPFNSLSELLQKSCDEFADYTAFDNFGSIITYRQLAHYSNALANYFRQELKLVKGDRIAVMMPNILQYPISIMAILCAGLVVVNVNPMYTKNELLQSMQDSQAKAIIVWDGAAHVVAEIIEQIPNVKIITTELGDLFSPIKRVVYQFVLKYIQRNIPSYHLPTSIDFRTAIAIGEKIKLPEVKIELEDMAFLQYTGGTTGTPKGAILTHKNMLSNIMQVVEWIKSKHKKGDFDVILSPLPFYHIFSLLANCLLFIHLGAHNVLITNPRDIPGFIKIMKKYRFHYLSGVNTLFNALLQNPKIKSVDFSQLKTALAGGMALQQVVADKWQALTGKVLTEGYGLTETSPAVTVMPLNATKFIGSAGLPLPSTDVQVRDDNNNVLPLNQPGELWVKGPQVMKGYWQKPQDTKDVMDDNGWLRTGDIAKIDEQGFVYLVDRKKDMIKVSGFNVYPNEVEDVVAKMPGVREVAAIGIPDEHSGEVVKLFIVKSDPNLTADDVKKYCHDNLTGYKRPKAIEFRDSLPKTNVGKILRRALR